MNVGKTISFIAGVGVSALAGGAIGAELSEFLPNEGLEEFEKAMGETTGTEGYDLDKAMEARVELDKQSVFSWSSEDEWPKLSQAQETLLGEEKAVAYNLARDAYILSGQNPEVFENAARNQTIGKYTGAITAGVAGGFATDAIYDRLTGQSSKWQDRIELESTNQPNRAI